MTSSLTVTFSGTSSVLQVDFLPEILLDEESNYSCALLDLIINNNSKFDLKEIINLNVIYINCDIISGSYIKGGRNHIIHQFATRGSLAKGQTFVEIPKHLNYFPIKTKNLRSIQISIVDHSGKELNINGGEITCRISIKRENNNETA